jgi:hypothetical protein
MKGCTYVHVGQQFSQKVNIKRLLLSENNCFIINVTSISTESLIIFISLSHDIVCGYESVTCISPFQIYIVLFPFDTTCKSVFVS